MSHQYQSRTRNRARRPPQEDSCSPVSWIVAIGFIFILACVAYPVVQKLLGGGQ